MQLLVVSGRNNGRFKSGLLLIFICNRRAFVWRGEVYQSTLSDHWEAGRMETISHKHRFSSPSHLIMSGNKPSAYSLPMFSYLVFCKKIGAEYL